MRSRILGGLVILSAACAGWAVTLNASDPVGVYAVVEKIVLEPSDAAPQRIQIWGAFCWPTPTIRTIMDRRNAATFITRARRGRTASAGTNGADLKTVAGKNTGIGFGGRYKDLGRVRRADEKAASPDTYPIQLGVVRMTGFRSSLPVVDRLKAALKDR